MARQPTTHTTLADWAASEALSFSLDSSGTFDTAVDTLIAALGDAVKVLGFGEGLHGGEEILQLRNRLFQRLVAEHGYSAIAIESSFPRGRAVNEYVAGRGPASYEAVQETGFSHDFGRLEANRELVEWMRRHNADPTHRIKLRFYGFDSPTEATSTDSPGPILRFVLDYLAAIDGEGSQQRRDQIESLLGSDAEWENPAALMDPAQGVGLSPAATALRIAAEDLTTELLIRRPELVARSDREHYLEAVQYASVARQLLNYHAALARNSDTRLAELLGIRGVMMADNLVYLLGRERGRGKILAFAHNGHVQRRQNEWQLGPQLNRWWPAGAHLDVLFGAGYASVGSGLGISEENGIGQPEPGTLEALLTGLPESGRFIPTHQGQGQPAPAAEIAALPTRSGSRLNSSYSALGPASFTDFDWLVILESISYNRGGPPLQHWTANADTSS